MLIVKSPIVLQSVLPLSVYADLLGEKIKANYRLIGTNITSEELLHMTMQRPDIYIGMENNGITNMLLAESRVHTDNQLKLELINQLVNRIMLYHSMHFTYQDEVFVASILQKMGITDVNKFMSQVSRHMNRNELLSELLNKYFLYGKDIASVVDSVVHSVFRSDAESTADSYAESVMAYENRFCSGRYLHNQIFRRLMTAECNNILYRYNNQVETKDITVAGIHDVTWMEQADAIQLSQLRENMFYQTDSAFWQQYSDNEAAPLEKNELTEEKIIRRMAAAVLEHMIQKIDYERQQHINDREGNKAVWRDYTNIFCQGTRDVVERFRYFQSEKIMDIDRIHLYDQNMRELIWDELRLSELLAFTDNDGVINNASNGIDSQKVYAGIRSNIVLSVLENQNFQKQMSENLKIKERFFVRTAQQETYYLEDEEAYINALRQFQEYYRILRQRNNDRYFSMNEEIFRQTQTVLTEESFRAVYRQEWKRISAAMREKTEQDVILDETTVQKINSRETGNTNILNCIDVVDGNDNATDIQKADTWYYYDSYLDEFLNRHADILCRQDIPMMENVKLLERINEHNIYMKQLLDGMTEKNDTSVIDGQINVEQTVHEEKGNRSGRVVVDLVQARRNALRVLENPQEVLNEIYDNAAAIRMGMPKEIERILSLTDEHSRVFYEQLLGYRDNKDADAASYDTYVINNISDGYSLETAESRDFYFTGNYNSVGTDSSESTEEQRNAQLLAESYKKGDIKSGKELKREINKENCRGSNKEYMEALRLQDSVYSLLRQIETKEENILSSIAVPAEVHTIKSSLTDRGKIQVINNIMADHEEMQGISSAMADHEEMQTTKAPAVSRVRFIHKTDASMYEEAARKIFETLRYMEPSMQRFPAVWDTTDRNDGKNEINIIGSIVDMQTLQKKLQDMKRELITQSEEHLTQFLNCSLKAQVHTISDKVYVELERRLKNEQRRRGY